MQDKVTIYCKQMIKLGNSEEIGCNVRCVITILFYYMR
jgi:hypothetical protein